MAVITGNMTRFCKDSDAAKMMYAKDDHNDLWYYSTPPKLTAEEEKVRFQKVLELLAKAAENDLHKLRWPMVLALDPVERLKLEEIVETAVRYVKKEGYEVDRQKAKITRLAP